jgi:hypothetical protein
VSAQDKPIHILHYKVINGDTLFVERITPSKCYSRLPRQKGKEWRKYYRLVHNFAKTYPYALASKKILVSVDSTLIADGLKRGKRDKYIAQVQKELFAVFEAPLRSMTVSQGALLMKLINREIGKTSFRIIKDYKNGIAAGFCIGIGAAVFLSCENKVIGAVLFAVALTVICQLEMMLFTGKIGSIVNAHKKDDILATVFCLIGNAIGTCVSGHV